jgi:hypothetical protein
MVLVVDAILTVLVFLECVVLTGLLTSPSAMRFRGPYPGLVSSRSIAILSWAAAMAESCLSWL